MAQIEHGPNNLHHFQIIDGEGDSHLLELPTRNLGAGVIAVHLNQLRFELGDYAQDPLAYLVVGRLSDAEQELPDEDQESKYFLGGRLRIAIKPFVIIEDVETRLRDREYDLLSFLTCSSNRYIEDEDILKAVWHDRYLLSKKYIRGERNNPYDNLRNHMSKLRRRLEAIDGIDPLSVIRNCRGHGYGFFDDSIPTDDI